MRSPYFGDAGMKGTVEHARSCTVVMGLNEKLGDAHPVFIVYV